jgi:hypothetical protein
MKMNQRQYRKLAREDQFKARHFPRIINLNHQFQAGTLHHFVLTIATTATLEFAAEAGPSWTLATDATFKRIQNGFPIISTGLITVAKSFQPVSISIVLSESTAAYKTVFRHVKDAIEKVSNIEFKPKFIMGDIAESITSAAEAIFPESRRLVCYAHVMKWLHHHMRYNYGIKSDPEWFLFRYRVQKLFLCHSIEDFKSEVERIATQYSHIPRLQEYIRSKDRLFDVESWKSKWFRGCYEELAALWQPRTNNATEGFNKKMKLEIFSNRIYSFQDSVTKLLGDDMMRFSIEATALRTDRIDYGSIERVWRSAEALRRDSFCRDHESTHIIPGVGKSEGEVYFFGNTRIFIPNDVAALGNDPRHGGPACTCKQFSRDFFCPHICACALLFRDFDIPTRNTQLPHPCDRGDDSSCRIGQPSQYYGLFRPKRPRPALQRMQP